MISDLPISTNNDNVVIVQPASTLNVPKKEFLEWADFGATFKEAIGVNRAGMIHIGNLSCCRFEEAVSPACFTPCYGKLSIVSEASREEPWGSHWARLSMTCDNPLCEMHLRVERLDPAEFENLMLHMMLKQAVPRLPTLNYVDCSQTKWEHSNSEETRRIWELGFVSVAFRVLYGSIGSWPVDYPRQYSLGFILMPQIRTANGCDGLGSWLQFLVCAKFAQLRSLQGSSLSWLLGPKPVT